MSRFLSLTKNPILKVHPKISPRFHSTKPPQSSQQIDLDFESATSASPPEDGSHVISSGVLRLEEVIQSMMVRRIAPDWLPFLPGYSYWVPPSASVGQHGKLIEVVGKVSAAPLWRQPALTKDQVMAFSTNKGWPSEAYFIQDTSPPHPLPMEMEVQVKIYDNPEATDEGNSEDDENNEG